MVQSRPNSCQPPRLYGGL